MRKAWIVTLGAAACLFGPGAGGRDDQRTLHAQIDSLLVKAVQPREPGLAIVVKRRGQIVFEEGYGVREAGKPEPIDPATNFRLASVTKQFTAMAIMLLVHDGKLRYNERLTELWADFPAYGRPITIRQLLTHTSGLRDYERLMENEEKAHGAKWSSDQQIDDNEVLSLLKAQDAGAFPAGTQWEYSNSGYVVLGLIVAKVSGMPFGDFLEKRIFQPLGMLHTIVYVKGKNEVTNRAFGHTKEGDFFAVTDQSPTSATLGDGGVYSSVQDMAAWDEGLARHKLLGEKDMLPAWTPAKRADGREYSQPASADPNANAARPPVAYGFGWFLDPYQGHARQYHDGETTGFRSTIERFANGPTTIIILSNRADLSAHDLGEKVADLVCNWQAAPGP